ncbi:hypothetical protein CCUS01_01152 [Colletotrichum cuscutae]|uniref:Uncharacterized protein n=1 Tax=Colletotrichum cuscutae TaxID=1209917 RepID=A0AAI9UWV2_9PEZI|nr:hypothetical protein CCUS01_01152 [Colletotrichum cuscutae]
MPCSNQTSRKLGTANRDAVPKPGLLGAPEPGRTTPLARCNTLVGARPYHSLPRPTRNSNVRPSLLFPHAN